MARGKSPFSAPFSNKPIKAPTPGNKAPARPHPKVSASGQQVGGGRKSAPTAGPNRAPKVTVTTKGRKPVGRKSPNTPKRAPGSMH